MPASPLTVERQPDLAGRLVATDHPIASVGYDQPDHRRRQQPRAAGEERRPGATPAPQLDLEDLAGRDPHVLHDRPIGETVAPRRDRHPYEQLVGITPDE